MKVAEFDFELPEELIALRPAEPRGAARLLVVRQEALEDRLVAELPALLTPGDLAVFNDTRVIPARLFGRRGAARVEILLHRERAPGQWLAFARPAKRLKAGQRLDFAAGFSAEIVTRGESGEVELRFDRAGQALSEALARHGETPLPPYIARRRAVDARDRGDYQTVFAGREGAVAAPTAGLHFTPELLAALKTRGVGAAFVTLHVGAGTFLPVKAEDTAGHRMHAEWGEVPEVTAAAIASARAKGGRVLAVGTTSLRLLESAADGTGKVGPFRGETDIFITPGYRFRAVDLLFTNFHLPRSTLFMLVAAFSGLDRMRAAYAHAIAGRYRFYSYGDACLLYPGPR
ncbi:MAG: tRNA preQ1(34) S-adenosylmethionine ribosyltransferase-isomerase QueA [Alphaproteobacteria bacterium]|nr:tRNA preQ1(34) S-adenosylmethionine ribosyltransferase-isomerase QueA [Alphaproteobacteria bacterium]